MNPDVPLPRGWSISPLKSIADYFIDGDWIETPFIEDSGIRLIQTGNIGIGVFIDKPSNQRFISRRTYHVLRCHSVEVDDILICRLADPVGRACQIPSYVGPAITSVDCTIFRPDRNIVNSRFALHWFTSPQHLKSASDIAGGSTRKRISRSNLGSLSVPLPLLKEQHEIAQILDSTDTTIRSTERLITKLELTKQGLIHDLLTCGVDELGKLRNPDLNPSQFCDTSLGLLPKEWAVVHIRDVAGSITSGSRAWAAYYAESGALFLRIGNLTREHTNLRLTAKSFVRPPVNAELRRTTVQPGDVLISITADLGIIGVVPDSLGEAYVNQHIALVRPTSRVLGRWIGYFLSSCRAQAQFAMLNDAGAKAGLNLPAVGRLKIGLPRSADERKRIVTILNTYESEIVTHQTSLTKLRSVKQGLMNDLLTGRVRVGVSG